MNSSALSNASGHALAKIAMKKTIVGHSEYKQIATGSSFSGELFSKKKQQFPTRRIYVSDVPIDVEENDIQKAFAKHGEVTHIENSDSPITDNTKSMFVTFANSKDAIEVLKNREFKLQQNTLRICEAVPKKSQVFVGGLRPETDEEDLIVFFSNYGTVCEAVLKTDGRTGLSRCFGFVTFVDSQKAVKELLKSRFLEMNGKRIELKPAVPMNQQSRMKRAQMAVAMTHANTQVSTASKLTNRKPAQEYSEVFSPGNVTYPNMYGSLPMDYGFMRQPYQNTFPVNRTRYQTQYRF